jgi:hypothetical protein
MHRQQKPKSERAPFPFFAALLSVLHACVSHHHVLLRELVVVLLLWCGVGVGHVSHARSHAHFVLFSLPSPPSRSPFSFAGLGLDYVSLLFTHARHRHTGPPLLVKPG